MHAPPGQPTTKSHHNLHALLVRSSCVADELAAQKAERAGNDFAAIKKNNTKMAAHFAHGKITFTKWQHFWQPVRHLTKLRLRRFQNLCFSAMPGSEQFSHVQGVFAS